MTVYDNIIEQYPLIQKSRKEYVCSICEQPIPVGSAYHRLQAPPNLLRMMFSDVPEGCAVATHLHEDCFHKMILNMEVRT